MFFAALLGGALNSVAGGGSFISFPALLFVGVPAVAANTTNTAALWPGVVASIAAYRRDFDTSPGVLVLLSVISVVGGLFGAALLLHTPEIAFRRLVPYLLATATALFALSDRIAPSAFIRSPVRSRGSLLRIAFVSLLQLVISIYGGYFGAGMGIVLLATLALIGMQNIHSMNAAKSLLSAIINGVAIVTFVMARTIIWPYALIMALGAIAGGYFGAYYGRRVEPKLVRGLVIAVGSALSTYFFVHSWM